MLSACAGRQVIGILGFPHEQDVVFDSLNRLSEIFLNFCHVGHCDYLKFVRTGHIITTTEFRRPSWCQQFNTKTTRCFCANCRNLFVENWIPQEWFA